MIKTYSIQLFAGNLNTNVTTQESLSPEMKTFYDTQLLQNARSGHYFTQFGKTQPLPKHNGKEAEWRKWNAFAVDTTPLTEGVTPDGDTLKTEYIRAFINQYGRYGAISDVLDMTAIDDVILGATEEFGALGSETMDIVTRNVLVAGTNVFYAPAADGSTVTTRAGLTATSGLTPFVVNKVATILKKNKAPKINGSYIAIIHPSVAMDLRESDGWVEAHKYSAAKEIFNGEIGELHGVRFIETENTKVWKGSGCPTGYSVYGCLFLGKDAYGVIEPDGAGMEMLVKGKGSGGTSDPLEQRSTVGFKFSTGSVILYPERLIRVECVSPTFKDEDDAN